MIKNRDFPKRQDDQNEFLDQVEGIASGVGLLAGNVSALFRSLNDKNKIDRNRNLLITGAAISFLILAAIMVLLLTEVKSISKEGNRRGDVRAQESTLARRQLADCQLPPGEVLTDGFINEGRCFLDTAQRQKQIVEEGTRTILQKAAEATAANKTLSDDARRAAQAQAGALKPTTTTTNTTRPVSPQILPTPQPRPLPTSPPSTFPPPAPPQSDNLLCNLLGNCKKTK